MWRLASLAFSAIALVTWSAQALFRRDTTFATVSNVAFAAERLTGVIDVYYACNDALAYDLAVTLNDWCFEADGTLNPARWQAMTAAYRARRELTDAERAHWPLLLRAAALRFWLSRLYDWTFPREGDVVHVKDPEQYRRILVHHREHAPPAL